VFFEVGIFFRVLYFFIAPLQQEDDFELDNNYDFFLNTGAVSSPRFLSWSPALADDFVKTFSAHDDAQCRRFSS
jgi:hypothetical protein